MHMQTKSDTHYITLVQLQNACQRLSFLSVQFNIKSPLDICALKPHILLLSEYSVHYVSAGYNANTNEILAFWKWVKGTFNLESMDWDCVCACAGFLQWSSLRINAAGTQNTVLAFIFHINSFGHLLSANHNPFEVRTKQAGKRNAFLTFFLQANLSVFASASSRSFLEQSAVIFSFLPHLLFGQTWAQKLQVNANY